MTSPIITEALRTLVEKKDLTRIEATAVSRLALRDSTSAREPCWFARA